LRIRTRTRKITGQWLGCLWILDVLEGSGKGLGWVRMRTYGKDKDSWDNRALCRISVDYGIKLMQEDDGVRLRMVEDKDMFFGIAD